MRRKRSVVGLAVVFAFAVALQSVVTGADGGTATSALSAQIHQQADATYAAVALANDSWTPRVAGLGIGLAVGLVAGGAGAYLKRGDA